MKSFLQEVSLGLSKKNKKLSSKWFYDFHGSKLFEKITKLDDYYPTRSELEILDKKKYFQENLPEHASVIEFGSGSNKKVKKLLIINCGNSGTTLRLITPLIAGSKVNAKIIGDQSLSKRPYIFCCSP